MSRMFIFGACLGLCLSVIGCDAGGDAVFEESEAPTAEEEAAAEAYGDAVNSASGGYDPNGGDPFAHTQE